MHLGAEVGSRMGTFRNSNRWVWVLKRNLKIDAFGGLKWGLKRVVLGAEMGGFGGSNESKFWG